MQTALAEAGLSSGKSVKFEDEIRVGLMSHPRHCWARQGHRVRQRIQLSRSYETCALLLDPVEATLEWSWVPNTKQESFAPLLEAWHEKGLQGLIWDGARGHIGALVKRVEVAQVLLPVASPELNPVERLIQEVRRATQGAVYESLEEKKAKVEEKLREYAADPEALCRLTGWAWIVEQLSFRPRPKPPRRSRSP